MPSSTATSGSLQDTSFMLIFSLMKMKIYRSQKHFDKIIIYIYNVTASESWRLWSMDEQRTMHTKYDGNTMSN